MMKYTKSISSYCLLMEGNKMFNRINKIIKSLFDSAEGKTETTTDGGEGYDRNVLSIPATRRIQEVPGDFEMDIQDEPRTEGYTNDNSEDVDINNLKNAKQW